MWCGVICGRARGRVAHAARCTWLAFAVVLACTGCSRVATTLSFAVSAPATARAAGGGGSAYVAPNHAVSFPLRVPRGVASFAETTFAPRSRAPLLTPRYRLVSPMSVADGMVFYLTYRDAAGADSLTVFVREPATGLPDRVSSVLPVGEGRTFQYLLPLRGASRVTGFQVSGTSAGSSIIIIDAGLRPDFLGIGFGPGDVVVTRAGVETREQTEDGGSVLDVTFPLSQAEAAEAGGATGGGYELTDPISLEYSYSPEPGTIDVMLSGPDPNAPAAPARSAVWELHPRPGAHIVYLYPADCDCAATTLRVLSSSNGFHPVAIARSNTVRGTVSSPVIGVPDRSPLTADFGALLSYDPAYWREPDFELFRWTRDPSVLVLDFRTREVASGYLARIASGAGTNSGTNSGTDAFRRVYRPEDFVRFFGLAHDTSAKESDRQARSADELELRDVLVANGVVIESGSSSLLPGTGAVLTVSHDGSYAVRSSLLRSEGYLVLSAASPAPRRGLDAVGAGEAGGAGEAVGTGEAGGTGEVGGGVDRARAQALVELDAKRVP